MVRDEEDNGEDAAGAEQHDGGEAVVGQTSAAALVEEFADGGECVVAGSGRGLRQEPGWPRRSPAAGSDDPGSRSVVMRVEDTILVPGSQGLRG